MGQDGNSNGTVFLSFLVGGVIGAGVALLYAPRSGRETRQKIKEYAGDVSEGAVDAYDHVKDRVAHAIADGKDYVSDQKAIIAAAIEAGKEAYEKEKAKHEKEHAKEYAKEHAKEHKA